MAPAIKTTLRKRLRVCHFRQRRNFVPRSCNVEFRNSRSSARILPLSDTSGAEKLGPVYLVERILERKWIKGQKFYKVRWQGFPPEADSWEPEENLSSILDSVASSHQVVGSVDSGADPSSRLSPAVMNSSESAPAQLSVQLESTLGSENIVGSDRNRPANEISHKRKDAVKSRIAGRYEYVPKHQLVASKTKYFDDIRDGKIDLSSNDLYSRVKTRRRANEGSFLKSKANPSHNLSSISRGESENDTNERTSAPSTAHSLGHEPHSPMSADSLNDFQSTIDSTESERLMGNFGDPPDSVVGSGTGYSIAPCAAIVSKPIPANPPTCITVDRWTWCVTEPHAAGLSTTEFESACVQAIPDMMDASVSPLRPLCYSPLLATNDDSAVGSSCANSGHSLCDTSVPLPAASLEPLDEVSGTTVPSLHQLINEYFSLIARVTSQSSPTLSGRESGTSANVNELDACAIPTLNELPKLQPYHSKACIRTKAELVEAVIDQRWALLATLPSHDTLLGENDAISQFTEEMSERITNSEHPSDENIVLHGSRGSAALLTLLSDGPATPTLVDRVLSRGLDPNTTLDFGDSSEPLLIRAVRRRRVHVVQALLDAGAKPDHVQPGSQNRTALGVALAAGDLDMVALLMLAGSNFYQVETQTTALSFVLRLLKQHAPQTGKSIMFSSFQNSWLHFKRTGPHSVPVPGPPEPSGISIPTIYNHVPADTIVDTAQSISRAPTLCSAPKISPSLSSCISAEPPPMETLKRMYELIAVHHARLSISVTELIRGWLFRSGLTHVALLVPCQWVNVRTGSFTVQFTWPMSTSYLRPDPPLLSSRSVAPILFLVHGRIVPPACYETWMDDDGPCLIKQVCLDESVNQKPLGRVPFVTTLFPLDWDASVGKQHRVRVDFRVPPANAALRPTCVAIMIIAVTSTTNGTTNSSTRTRPPHALSFSTQSHQPSFSQRSSPYATPFRSFS